MMLEPDCGYFNEERDDEYAPPYGECEECYRYDICLRAKIEEIKKVEEWLYRNNVYIVSSINNEGVHIGGFAGLSLDVDGDLIINADICRLSCTT